MYGRRYATCNRLSTMVPRRTSRRSAIALLLVISASSRAWAYGESDDDGSGPRFHGPAIVPTVHLDSLVPIAGAGIDLDPAPWFVLGVNGGVLPDGITVGGSARLRIPAYFTERAVWAITLEGAYSMVPTYSYGLATCIEHVSSWSDGSRFCYDTPVRVHEHPRFLSGLVGVEVLTRYRVQVRGYIGGGRMVADSGVHSASLDGTVEGGGKEGVVVQLGLAAGYRFEL